jgi:drug/metabolite transporter (DMT)-like permease
VAALYGLVAGALFGAMGIAVRVGLQRRGDAEGGAAIVTSVAALVALALAAATGGGEVAAGDLLPFALVGALVPGVSSLLLAHAIQHAGASRALIVIGTAPLLSVLLAVMFLDEPLELPLAIGTVFVVAAGTVLAGETRPEHFRVLGGVLALLCAVLFAGRDNLVRWASRDVHPPPLVATATSLVCAAAVLIAWLVVARRRTVRARVANGVSAFTVAGLCLGLAYASLIAGLDRGRVSVVAPLNATQSLWAVVFAALFLRRSEAIGRRVMLAAVLVVAGGALIGVFR